MKTQVILIDWENVQPKILSNLDSVEFRLFIFLGPLQNKLSIETVEAVQLFGERAKYVKTSKKGNNALDMLIAFYIGRLCVELPDAEFHVISKDTDYDPLIEHLKTLSVKATRWVDLSAIQAEKKSKKSTEIDCFEAYKIWIAARKINKPKTIKTLRNSIKRSNVFNWESDKALGNFIEAIQTKGWIKMEEGKVEYNNI